MANEFFTILTAAGRNKLAAATATATPLALTQMAVGDGDPATPGGAYYSPTEAQTTLKHEVWRGAINHLAVDANNQNWIVAELVIPDNVGSFYIREVGLFDSAGTLIAVGKFPESYKPTLAAGSNKQLYVRMILEVTNTTAVTLLVDPSVVLATRQYCDDKVAAEINKLDGKQSVLVATTAAIALTDLQTIDGVVLAAGDRVLVKNQAQPKDNGIYVVAASVWVRAADADTAIEVTPGLFVSVEKGTANADSIWQLVTDAPITLGATSLLWEMVSGKAGITAGTYRQVTVDQRGRVTGGTNPTTRAGYGLADAAASGANSDITELNAVVNGSVFRKNLVVDGSCRLAQLAAKNISAIAQYGAVDMFAAWASGTAVSAGTISQSAVAPIGTEGYSLHFSGVTVTGAGVIYARHRVESAIARQLKNKAASFSVMVYHDVGAAVNYTAVIRKANAADNFSGVTVIGSSAANAIQSATGTLLKFENVAMGDCSNGIEIEVQAVCGAVVTKSFHFTEWQMEEGGIATAFDRPSIVSNIDNVLRYLEKTYDIDTLPGSITFLGAFVGDTSGVNDLSCPFRVVKRAIPSITYYSALSGASGVVAYKNTMTVGPQGDIAVDASYLSKGMLSVQTSPGDNYMPIIHFVADCRL